MYLNNKFLRQMQTKANQRKQESATAVRRTTPCVPTAGKTALARLVKSLHCVKQALFRTLIVCSGAVYTNSLRPKLYKFMSEKNWNCYCVCTSYVRRLFRFGVRIFEERVVILCFTLRVCVLVTVFWGDCVWISSLGLTLPFLSFW